MHCRTILDKMRKSHDCCKGLRFQRMYTRTLELYERLLSAYGLYKEFGFCTATTVIK